MMSDYNLLFPDAPVVTDLRHALRHPDVHCKWEADAAFAPSKGSGVVVYSDRHGGRLYARDAAHRFVGELEKGQWVWKGPETLPPDDAPFEFIELD